MKKLMHIARRQPVERLWTPPFIDALQKLGELEILADGDDLTDEEAARRIRDCHVLLTSWEARRLPDSLAEDRGELEYICHVTGEMTQYVSLELIDAGIPVTNWGDVPAHEIAEGAMVLLLAMVKNLRARIKTVETGGWRPNPDAYSGSLKGMDVGVYGCGFIGRRFIDMLRPFGPIIRVYDPYIDAVPEGCSRVDDLRTLFSLSRAVAIHAGLTAETRNSVDAERLSLLPDYGILINTARGGLVDQRALFAELASGRLLAALDVLEPDRPLPLDHPARQWPNAVFTAHTIGSSSDAKAEYLLPIHRVCLENIERHLAGRPLHFIMDRERYLLST